MRPIFADLAEVSVQVKVLVMTLIEDYRLRRVEPHIYPLHLKKIKLPCVHQLRCIRYGTADGRSFDILVRHVGREDVMTNLVPVFSNLCTVIAVR